uniref:Uncharacterized protein n=1 Tax=Photinus pyralis TaxID=7054 RepID=A0A1Y1KKK5_PHOPY
MVDLEVVSGGVAEVAVLEEDATTKADGEGAVVLGAEVVVDLGEGKTVSENHSVVTMMVAILIRETVLLTRHRRTRKSSLTINNCALKMPEALGEKEQIMI